MAEKKKPASSNKAEDKAAVKTAAKSGKPKIEYVERDEPVNVKQVDSHQYITVKNGFYGTLVYKSKKTGETFLWNEFGDEQEMELGELKNAKNSNKKMFINNWFLFNENDDWVIDYLGVRQYYKNAISIEGYDSIFKEDPERIKKIIGEMTDGQKHSLEYRARVLINNGGIDSRKVISALEEALQTELIER